MTAAVDLFAGPGGWSEACKMLGIDELGIEHDAAAVATRTAAGHRTIHADVSMLDPAEFTADGLIASPPCPAFSSAGKGEGREHLPALVAAVHRRDWTARPSDDPKVWLGLEIGRWWETIRPEWVALEQVPAVLPLWEAYAHVLRADGYSAWTGVLCAADYGVPQTRNRAVLIASRTRTVAEPPPSHIGRWVSWGSALGYDTGRIGFARRDDRGDSPDGYRERDWRDADRPSFTLTEKARSWVIDTGRAWVVLPDDEPDRTSTVRLSIADALTLQGFRSDYPIRWKSDAQLSFDLGIPDAALRRARSFEQIGNAIPPPLAAAVLRTIAEEAGRRDPHPDDRLYDPARHA